MKLLVAVLLLAFSFIANADVYLGSYATTDKVTVNTFFKSNTGTPTEPTALELNISCTDGTTWTDHLTHQAVALKTAANTSTADSGSTTTLVDTALTEADDYWNGYILKFTSGSNNGLEAIVTDFVASTDTLTFAPEVPYSVGTETFKLFKPHYAYTWTISGPADGDRCFADVIDIASTGKTQAYVFDVKNDAFEGKAYAITASSTTSITSAELSAAWDILDSAVGNKRLLAFPSATENPDQGACSYEGFMVEVDSKSGDVYSWVGALAGAPETTCKVIIY